MTSITSTSPTNGEVLGRYDVMGDDAVRAAVDTARIAARWWGDLGWTGRRARLMAFKHVLARRAEEIADLVHREGGKPFDDALLEVVLSVEHLDWAARSARRVLAERPVRPSLLTINQRAALAYEPVGVVGVIGPWNYPVFTPIGSVGYALAAGNAVVFKPSEWTTAVGAWLVERFAEVVPEQPVWQLITGDGSTGAALCAAGTDTIAFTGSTAVGKKIMAACAPTLTPVVLECGGKDAVLVDFDADVRKAADAVAFGAFSNAGQTCVSTERAYVHESVYDAFVDALADIARSLQPGTQDGASYGPMTMPSQVDVVHRHISDAIARGGRAVVGGVDSAEGGRVVGPVVLTGVPEDSAAVVEETFGPTIVVNRVRDLDEAVDHANASHYGLAAAIFGRNRARCEAAARRLRVGMVSINSWSMNAGVPALPWGGVGESGIGRIHGEDGLRAFTSPKAMVSERFPLPVSLTSFDRPASAGRLLAGAIKVLHGGAPWRR